MTDDKKLIQGIYSRTNKKFYYLNTGNVSNRFSIDRLRSLLINRGLLTYHKTDFRDTGDTYKIMTLEDAEASNYEVEVIYLNKHIQKVEETKKSEEVVNPWKK